MNGWEKKTSKMSVVLMLFLFRHAQYEPLAAKDDTKDLSLKSLSGDPPQNLLLCTVPHLGLPPSFICP